MRSPSQSRSLWQAESRILDRVASYASSLQHHVGVALVQVYDYSSTGDHSCSAGGVQGYALRH